MSCGCCVDMTCVFVIFVLRNGCCVCVTEETTPSIDPATVLHTMGIVVLGLFLVEVRAFSFYLMFLSCSWDFFWRGRLLQNTVKREPWCGLHGMLTQRVPFHKRSIRNSLPVCYHAERTDLKSTPPPKKIKIESGVTSNRYNGVQISAPRFHELLALPCRALPGLSFFEVGLRSTGCPRCTWPVWYVQLPNTRRCTRSMQSLRWCWHCLRWTALVRISTRTKCMVHVEQHKTAVRVKTPRWGSGKRSAEEWHTPKSTPCSPL